MPYRTIVAIAIFLVTDGLIMAGEKSPRKLDKPSAGLLGAVLMVLCGVLTRQEALAAIDFPTLALLLGMMVVIHYATVSGLLDAIAHALVDRSRDGKRLLWMVCLSAGLLSALFVNDTICLLMTPLVLTATTRKRLAPEPFLLAIATSSNVGSLMTLTGNPQNMLIGQSSSWAWGAFALRMVPIGVVCLAINGWLLGLLYHKKLTPEADAPDCTDEGKAEPLQKRLAAKTVVVLVGLLIAFLCGAPMEVAALTAAVAIILLANRRPEETFAAVDWSLLLFFAGLFVVVAGVTKVGGAWLTRQIPTFTRDVTSLGGLTRFSVASVVGSNLFSNVPFVMLLRHDLTRVPHAPLLWLALAATSTLAGNLTLVGSVANLIVAQKAKDRCPLSFVAFLKIGVPSTLLTVVVSVLMLWGYTALHWVR
jgi:Na+/H+ antiporter NhaD/arsenite permease-like protein